MNGKIGKIKTNKKKKERKKNVLYNDIGYLLTLDFKRKLVPRNQTTVIEMASSEKQRHIKKAVQEYNKLLLY